MSVKIVTAALRYARHAALVLASLLVATPALASVVLAWDAVAGAAGYVLHYGSSPGSYTWRVDVGNGTTYTIGGLAEGATYYFAATAYDAARAESAYSNSVSKTIAYSAPVARFSASTTSGAAPLAMNFINESTGSIQSHSWTFGDGTSSTAANPSKLYSAAGVYSVELTVTGPGGTNKIVRSNYVTVTPTTTPVAPTAQFAANVTSGPAPLTVVFTSTSTGNISSYLWTFGDGTTSTAANPSKQYSAPGVYSVELTVTGTSGSNKSVRTNYITVTPTTSSAAPTALFAANVTSGRAPMTVVFKSTSTGNISSYYWTFGDGSTSTAAAPTYKYLVPGFYTVTLKVTGPSGSNTKISSNYIHVKRRAVAKPALVK